MTVSVDAVATLAPSASQNPSFQITPVGAPNVVIAFAMWQHAAGADGVIPSATYGGQAMTPIDSLTLTSRGVAAFSYPSASGSQQTIQFNYSTAPDGNSTGYAALLLNGDQNQVVRTVTKTNTIAQTSVSLNVLSTALDLILDGICVGLSPTQDGAQTLRMSPQTLSTAFGAGSSKPGVAPSTNMLWTFASASGPLIVVAVKTGELNAGAESAYLPGNMQPQTSPLTVAKW